MEMWKWKMPPLEVVQEGVASVVLGGPFPTHECPTLHNLFCHNCPPICPKCPP